MILVDTSILGRIASVQSPLHPVAMQTVAKLIRQGRRLHVTPQNLCEFWVVATRPVSVNGFGWSTDRTVAWIYRFEHFFSLIPENDQIHPQWRYLVQHYDTSGKPAHDARLAAIMHVHGINTILTFDRHGFERYPITILDPRALPAS